MNSSTLQSITLTDAANEYFELTQPFPQLKDLNFEGVKFVFNDFVATENLNLKVKFIEFRLTQ